MTTRQALHGPWGLLVAMGLVTVVTFGCLLVLSHRQHRRAEDLYSEVLYLRGQVDVMLERDDSRDRLLRKLMRDGGYTKEELDRISAGLPRSE